MKSEVYTSTRLAKGIAFALALGSAGSALAQSAVSAEALTKLDIRVEALETKAQESGFSGLKISGVADPVYLWTSHNGGSFNFLNSYDENSATDTFSYANSSFGRVMVNLEKTMESGTVWSLKLNARKGYNGIIDEAKVTVPLSDSTHFFAGQIGDWSGYEYADANVNQLITHNTHFDFLMPSYYTGAGFDFTSGNFVGKILLGNIDRPAGTKEGQDQAPVLTYRVDWSQGDYAPFATGWGIGSAGHIGYKKLANQVYDANTSTWTADGNVKKNFALFEVDFYKISGAMEYTGEIHLGQMEKASFAPDSDGHAGKASWQALSGQILYRATPQLALIARGDYIKNDRNGGGVFGSPCPGGGCTDGVNGFGPGMERDADGIWVATDPNHGVNRYALSLGLNYAYNANTNFKIELRRDWANGKVFQKINDSNDVDFTKSRDLIGLGMVVHF